MVDLGVVTALSHKLGWPESEMDIKLGRCASSPLSVTASQPISSAIRLQLHALAYNLAKLMRTLALLKNVEHWWLTTLREKLITIGAKVVRHGRYITFQLAEVAVSRALFAQILGLIANLRAPPPKPA